ncbi:FMN-dependent NADH-azoreductase [Bermanella sp. WJH001]|uniref:FMN-dependent NADH-azoreductase n=1 Tax=Bermanella sp. WJH001 TaxID=3048005 RepID=UPI0024BD743B|nr:NAD(P)H-dependent oxidoreductase [Bermanella sp. WJH001]MDJ1539430.1 NAD(P)H-dependent oxidoreductase [Bermanella sp. WJH001]
MSTLLQINTGIFAENSHSTVLANQFTANYLSQNPATELVVRDLISEPIPHLDASIIGAFASEEAARTPEQQAILDFSQGLIDELANADAVVLGLPMYNFSVPSQLKAYMDQIARAGVTFKYTETGPVGLLNDKPVYVVAARGGIHEGQPSDSQTAFVKTFFAFIGLSNVQFIYAEGLNMGDDAQKKAYDHAKKSISAITA